MSELIIKNLKKRVIQVEDKEKTLLNHFQESRIDLMHACGGKGRCTTCKLEILDGYESLSEPSAFEKRCQETGVLKAFDRLACQAKLLEGSATVSIPAEYQLPHMEYPDS